MTLVSGRTIRKRCELSATVCTLDDSVGMLRRLCSEALTDLGKQV
jgi:hypothetical protein